MKILLDQGVPAPLRSRLSPHTVETAADREWNTLTNGELLDSAEDADFQILITTDQNLRHQQNLDNRHVGVLVLRSTSWPKIANKISEILAALPRLESGGIEEIEI